MPETITSSVPELLAPAGNLTCALAAFDAGADAVYAGLQAFNAREGADNFSVDDLARLTAYARRHRKRVYVTVNTLVREMERPAAAELLSCAADQAPHAVIVQDLGVLRMIRDHFPGISVHASTQMGTHNSAGVTMLAEMGVERVILQRQILLSELRDIVARSRIEVEIFAHGALCCGLSGACLFSSWMGGWSGNRGKCKQPCRRRYFSEQGNGFFFSPQDLYTLDLIPDFKQLGVAGLKIEGRLRNADYVRRVVAAYRLVLDAPAGDEGGVLKEARGLLGGALGRRWSHGFYTPESRRTVIQHESFGTAGLLVGKVAGQSEKEIAVRLSRPLETGDRIRIQPPSAEEGPAFVIARLIVDGAAVEKAPRGQICTIPTERAVPAEGWVFKTGHQPPDFRERIAALWRPRTFIDLVITVAPTGIRIAVTRPPRKGTPWECRLDIPPARNRPLTEAHVREVFRTAGTASIAVAEVDVCVDGELFVEERQLRRVRRAFCKWLEENGPRGAQRYPHAVDAAGSEWASAMPTQHHGDGRTTVFVRDRADSAGEGSLVARDLSVADARTDEAVLPAFCPEPSLAVVAGHIERALALGIRRFRVTSLYGLLLLRGHGEVEITCSFPFPVANIMALREVCSLGAHRATAWIELDKAAVHALIDRAPGRIEIYSYGRPALLTTRAGIPAGGRVTDARGNVFHVDKDSEHVTRIYPHAVMDVPVPANADRYIDLTHAEHGETATSTFNWERVLQ